MLPRSVLIARRSQNQWPKLREPAAKFKQAAQILRRKAPGFDLYGPLASAALKDPIHLERLFPPVAHLLILMDRKGQWRVRFNSDWIDYDAYFDNWSSYDTEASSNSVDGLPFSGNVGTGPYSAIIFSQDS